jgi:hypothetical protein
LRWNYDAGGWVLVGDAGELALTTGRKKILDVLKNQWFREFTPANVADLPKLELTPDAAQKQLTKLVRDGWARRVTHGRYQYAGPAPDGRSGRSGRDPGGTPLKEAIPGGETPPTFSPPRRNGRHQVPGWAW